MKKLFSMLLALTLVAALAACGAGGGGSSGGPTGKVDDVATITVWCWDPNFNLASMEVAKKHYATVNPNLTVDVQEVSWNDIQTRMNTAFMANQELGADIILMQNMAARKNISTYPDAFVDLTGKIDHGNFAPYVVQFGTYDGKIYHVPFDSGATGSFMRTDIIGQAGLTIADFNDVTWDRYIELGKQVKDATGIHMLSMEPGSADIIDTMMSSAGQWYFKDDATPFMVGNESLRESIATLVKMRDAGIILDVSSWDEYVGSLNNGTVVGTIQGIWIVGSIRAQDAQAGNWGMAKTPKLTVSGASTAGSQGGSSWYVISSSKHQAASIDFLAKTFGSNVDFYNEILPGTGAVATYTPAASGSNYSDPQEFFGGQPIFADILGQAALIPRFDYGTFVYEARDSMHDFLGNVRSEADIEKFLADAEAQTRSLMS